MIKFEFTLSDQDASNLMNVIQNAIVDASFKAQEFIKPKMTATDQMNCDWYNSHADYLKELKQKILEGNHRV